MREFTKQKHALLDQIELWECDLKRYQAGTIQTFSWERGLRKDISSERIKRLQADINRLEKLIEAYEKLERLPN